MSSIPFYQYSIDGFYMQLVIKKKGRPRSKSQINVSSVKQGTKINETRATFIINESILYKIKAIAYYRRTSIKEILNSALKDYLDKISEHELLAAHDLYKKK